LLILQSGGDPVKIQEYEDNQKYTAENMFLIMFPDLNIPGGWTDSSQKFNPGRLNLKPEDLFPD
jgi:hypothetical protein